MHAAFPAGSSTFSCVENYLKQQTLIQSCVWLLYVFVKFGISHFLNAG